MEKFAKSIEVLRSYLTDRVEGNKKAEKILHLTLVADFTCTFDDSKKIQDFSQLLATVIEIILIYCGDSDSDVRSNAAECLEKISRAKINFVFKILANLFKELKRCDNPRSLKVALIHISDLIPYVQTQKFNIIKDSFAPEIKRLAVNENEAILETLPIFIDKVYSILGASLTQKDVSSLCVSFFPNLSSKSSVACRSASMSIYHLCRHSSYPVSYSLQAMRNIWSKILPIDFENTNSELLVGSVVCVRHLLGVIDANKNSEQIGNFADLLPMLTLNYEIFCHLCKHQSSVVVTAALEALLTLLKICTPGFKKILTSAGSITKTQLFDNPADVFAYALNDTFDAESVYENSEMASKLEENAKAEVPLFSNRLANRAPSIGESSCTDLESIATSSKRLSSSTSSSIEDLPDSIRALTVKSSSNAAAADEDEVNAKAFGDFSSNDGNQLDETLVSSAVDFQEETESALEIGYYLSTLQSPASYILRMVTSQFLLTGTKSTLRPDKEVRISIKSLALQIVAQVCALEDLKDLQFSLEINLAGVSQNTQMVEDLFLFMDHSDPQIRSGCILIYGALINRVLEANCLEVASFSQSVEVLLKSLNDTEAPVVRATLSVMSSNINLLTKLCPNNALIIDILESALFLKPHKYWLVRVSLLEFFLNVDFHFVAFHESKCLNKTATGLSIQNQILDFVIEQLQNSNQNIRESACKTLLALVPKLYIPDYSSSKDILKNISDDMNSCYSPVFKSVSEVYSVDKSMQFQKSYSRISDEPLSSSQLAQKVAFATDLLFRCLTNVNEGNGLSGILQAMRRMCEAFPPSKFPNAWQISATENDSFQSFGIINLCINLLNFSSITSNVISHSHLIDLITALLTRSALGVIDKPENFDNISKVTRDWPAIKDQTLSSLFTKVLHHLLKCLNVIDHVLRNKEPVSSPTKTPKLPGNLPSLPSYFPNTSNIPSPIRKKGQKFVETAVTKAKSTSATLPSFPSKFLEEAKKDSGLSIFQNSTPPPPVPPKPLDPTFSHEPNFVQLFEILSNMSKTLKVSSLTTQTDKLIIFTSSILKSIGTLFQFASTSEISLYVDSILSQVEICLHLTPVEAIGCVQNLFNSVFGTSVVHNPQSQSCDIKSMNKTKNERSKMSLYGTVFTDPYMRFTQNLAPHAHASCDGDINVGSLKREMKLKPGHTFVFQHRMPLVNQHIKSFETLVLNSLRKYSSSSRPCDRLIVIELLCQLINLKVNYNLLDNEHTFLKFLSDQLSVFANVRGDVPDVICQLVSHAMAFYIQLSHQKFEGVPIVLLERITQHCDLLTKVNHKMAVSVLRPVIHDLFARRGVSQGDPEEQLTATNQLETSGSTAARQIISVLLLQLCDCTNSWDMLTVALKHARHEGDMQHKTFSRQCCDALIPLLENGEITFETVLDVERLQQLLSLLHPSLSLSNSENLLRLLFRIPPVDSLTNFKNFMAVFLSIVHVICRISQEDLILNKVKQLKTKIVSDTSPIFKSTKPEDLVANQYLLIVSTLTTDCFEVELDKLCQYIHMLFQHLQFLIKSSSPFAKKFAESFAKLINGTQISTVLATNVITLNEKLKRLLMAFHPYLFLQWCDVLFSVGYTKDQSWWPSILGSNTSQNISVETNGVGTSPFESFLKKACFLLLIDSAVATAPRDTDPMNWAIVHHVVDIVAFLDKPPISDFFAIVCRNPSLSGLLVQKLYDNKVIQAVVKDVNCRFKFLSMVKMLHATSSHKIFLLLCGKDVFINSSDLAFQRGIVTILVGKLQYLINSATSEQLPLEELGLISRKLVNSNKMQKKYPELIAHIVAYFEKYSNQSQFLVEYQRSQQIEVSFSSFTSLDSNFISYYLNRTRSALSDSTHALFIQSFDTESAKLYLSQFDVQFALLLKLFQAQMKSLNTNSGTFNTDFLEFISETFVQKVERAAKHINDEDISFKGFNVFVHCFDYYVTMNPTWVQKLVSLGSPFLNLIEFYLNELVVSNSDLNCDVYRVLKFIPFAAILVQNATTKLPFEKSAKLCKLLMLLTRNLLPRCFPSIKASTEFDDLVTTVRESSQCVLLLDKEPPSNELSHCIKQAIASLCRHVDVIEICRMPEEMWKNGFSVSCIGDKPRNLDTSFLIDPDIFWDFQSRTELFGWINRHSFEEIWMIYLSVLNASNDDEFDDLQEKWKIRKMSFNAIISLVAIAMRTVVPGNPTVTAPNLPSAPTKQSKIWSGRKGSPEIHYSHVAKLKRDLTQPQGIVKSASIHFAEILSQGVFVELSSETMESVKVDLNSCVVLLNEQCHHWLNDPTIPTSVVCDVFKGLILLSNLYVDTNQFDWLYMLISSLHRTLPAEDELTALYTIPLLCQSLNATTDIDRQSEEIEHLISIFVNGLNSPMLSIETTTLNGLSLLMKCSEKNRSILSPIVTNNIQNYVINRITAATSLVATSPSEYYMLSLIAVTFDTINNFINELRESEFISTIVQMFLVYSSSCTKNVFCAIFTRIDELVVSQSLNRRVTDFIIKACFEHINSSSSKTSIRYSLSLLLSCIYSYYPPAVHNLESDENISIDSIERVTRIIEKFEFSSTQHAKIIVRPLSRLMIDYLNLHERFYKATSLTQKHRHTVGQSYSVYLLYDIFQNLIHNDSEKVLLELLWPPFPSIICQFENCEDACNTLCLILVSAITSSFGEALIGHILDCVPFRANHNRVQIVSNHSSPVHKLLMQQVTKFCSHLFYSTLDCDSDRVQFKDSLSASGIKFISDIANILK